MIPVYAKFENYWYRAVILKFIQTLDFTGEFWKYTNTAAQTKQIK